jgi:hypothetical protein
MKITFCVLGILCFAGMAFGQAGSATSSGISAEPIVYEFQSHSARAAQQGMGQAQDIMEQSINVQAHGVRPLWEVAKPTYVAPLGDSARLLRKEHMSAKKAEIVWNN